MAAKVDGRYFDKKDAELLIENNFSHIRLGAKLNKYISAGPEYTLDQDRIKDLQNYIDILLEHGLMVVLDPVHQFNEVYTDASLPALKSIWKQVSTAFKDYPVEKLAFEIMNEPHDDYNLYNLVNQSLDEIRAVPGNEHRIVIVSGQGFSTREALISAFDENIFPADDPCIIGTFHYYDPRNFTKQGTFEVPVSWADNGDNDPEWDLLSEAFDQVKSANDNWASRQYTIPIPIYLGEFGVDNAAAFNDRMRWFWWVRNQAEKRNFSHALWNMYNDNLSSKGIGPWTDLQKNDPSTRSLDINFVEALIGRYEIEDGQAYGISSETDTSENVSGASLLISGIASGVDISSIYTGRSGTYNLFLRYRNGNNTPANIILQTKKAGDTDFRYSKETTLEVSASSTWSHIHIPLQFDVSQDNILRIELLSGDEIEFDFIAISSGQYSQILYPPGENNTGIIESRPVDKVRIIPNPVSSNIFILQNHDQTKDLIYKMELRDLSGKTVFLTHNIKMGDPIALTSQLSNGIYMVQCYDRENNISYIGKLSLLRTYK